jgi:hypothetical protein
MINLWQSIQRILPMAAILLLCVAAVPAQDQTNNTNTSATAATNNSQTNTATAEVLTSSARPKAKAITKPREKSVLDAEVLESPLSYFKRAFSSDEEEQNDTYAANPGAVVITVKALIATLLSTIM